MATIALSGNTIGCSLGIGSFESLGKAFLNSKNSTGGLSGALGSLKNKIDIASIAVKADTSQQQVKQADSRETEKKSSLTLAYDKLDTLVSDVGVVDTKVSGKVDQRKDDFYKKYSYLKPECEKSTKEKLADFGRSVWNGICSVGKAIGNKVKGVVEWCKEHWKELLIGIAFIVVGALITVFTAGTGTAFWAAFGAALAKGFAMAALSAAISGTMSAGITYYKCRKSGLSPELSLKYAGKAFGDGLANGFMTGGIGFAAGAGMIGAFGKSALIGKSFWGSVGKGAMFGAGTNAITSPIVTAISYWLKNGTLEGSGELIFQSTISGIISGGIFGGIMGGAQFKYAEYKVNKIESSIAERSDLKPTEQGKLYESELIDEFAKRYPDSKYDSQCHLNSENLINQKGNASYQKPDLLVENKSGDFTNYDFKWGNAGKTYNQKVLTGGGSTHVMDTVISGSNTNFTTNVVPAGTPFIEIHVRSFNSIVGVPINGNIIIGGSSGINSGLVTDN